MIWGFKKPIHKSLKLNETITCTKRSWLIWGDLENFGFNRSSHNTVEIDKRIREMVFIMRIFRAEIKNSEAMKFIWNKEFKNCIILKAEW